MIYQAIVYSKELNEFMEGVFCFAESMQQARQIFEGIAKLHGHHRPQGCIFNLTIA